MTNSARSGRVSPPASAGNGTAVSSPAGNGTAVRGPAGNGTTVSSPAAGGDHDHDGPDDDAGTPAELVRLRRRMLVALTTTAAASAVALVAVLLTWVPEPPAADRAATAAEAERLAAMRVTNHRDVRAGLRVVIGAGGNRTDLLGWIDWARPLVYLDVGGPGAGDERGLLQATPTVALTRPDPTAVPTPALPPLLPPADRWRLREPSAERALDVVLRLVFALAAPQPDPVATGDEARWLGRADAAGGPLDILRAALPGAPALDDQPRLWLDRDARLHRLTTRLPGGVPLTVELLRADRPVLRPVPALGGRPGLPRALTEVERRRFTRLATRLRATGGARLTLTAPVTASTNLRGAGWVSWTERSAYLSVADLATPGQRTLLRHDRTGAARLVTRAAAADGTAEAPGRPPLPPPTTGWRSIRTDRTDPDRLLAAALRAGRTDVSEASAVRLREDRLAERTVDVIEVPDGAAPLRYWIDRDGLLRRLELRTAASTWSQLDLVPGPVPRLSALTAATPSARPTARPVGAPPRTPDPAPSGSRR
ncbi:MULTISPECIES: hypothetical protein [Micromonospora]|uniref:Uncharacterized protein n=1 Tax=Micromonospora yangpuensis TaxID=683228 RepID=A0A1C6UYW2_9ACTN|nr:hypothetical protein [Micromonospora yangpuensis]GGL95722.1 hypothetical protein GCM10012279_11450 [Micromonospora yangpuensis]SCL59243.1 hypothetical protein GA0070617_4044 [Micromonospora yangpuensis]